MHSSRIFCWFLFLLFTFPVFGQRLSGTWTHLSPEYKGVTWPACWLDIEARGDHLYLLYSDYEILYMVHSSNLGKTWNTEIVEDMREWPRALEVNKIPARSDQDAEIMQQWAKEGHINISTWKTSMVVDADGGVHVAYILSYGNIHCSSMARYAYRSPKGKWSTSVIRKIENTWLSNEIDIALDNSGKVHVAFLENGALQHATTADEQKWEINQLLVSAEHHDGNGSMGGVNIEVDSKNRIHIGCQAINRPFVYAVSDDGGINWDFFPISPPGSGQIWFETGMGLDRFDRPHVILRVLHDHLLHAVLDDHEWRLTRATPDPGNRGEPFFDGKEGMYMVYYPTYSSLAGGPLRLASTQNFGINWMHETVTMDAAGTCSGAYGDCAVARDRLYVVYHRNDTTLGLDWKPLKEVGIQDPTLPLTPSPGTEPDLLWKD